MSPVRFTVSLHGLHALFGDDVRAVVDVATQADELGIHAVSLPDHVAMGVRVEDYPYGDFPLPESFPWYEPLTVLAAIAAATSRIHLTTSVLIAPLRPAALLAKIGATLDCVSRGRFELGVGSGWQREEYDAVGVPFDQRKERLIDTLRACRVLWSGERRSFHSPSARFEEILSLPAPRREIPLWLGMKATPRARGWMAELGAGWVPMAVDPVRLKGDIESIREAYSASGRNPDELRVRAGLPIRLGSDRRPELAATLDAVDAAISCGVTDIEIFLSAFARSASDIDRALASIAAFGTTSYDA